MLRKNTFFVCGKKIEKKHFFLQKIKFVLFCFFSSKSLTNQTKCWIQSYQWSDAVNFHPLELTPWPLILISKDEHIGADKAYSGKQHFIAPLKGDERKMTREEKAHNFLI